MAKVCINVVYKGVPTAFHMNPANICKSIVQASQQDFKSKLGHFDITDLELRDSNGSVIPFSKQICDVQKNQSDTNPFEICVKEDVDIHLRILFSYQGAKHWDQEERVVRNNDELARLLGNRDRYLVPIDPNERPLSPQQIREYRDLDKQNLLYELCEGNDWLAKIAQFESFVNNEGCAIEVAIVRGLVNWLNNLPGKSSNDISLMKSGAHVYHNFENNAFCIVFGETETNKDGYAYLKQMLPPGAMARPAYEFDGLVIDSKDRILYVIECKHSVHEGAVKTHMKKLKDLAEKLREGKVQYESNCNLVQLDDGLQVKGVIGGRYFPIGSRREADSAGFVSVLLNGNEFSVDNDSLRESRNYANLS